MAELKTKPDPKKSVQKFIESVENEKRRADAFEMLKIMTEVTKEKPMLWGTSIIGFGNYDYKYDSGRTGNWFPVGFSPRKTSLVLYSLPCFDEFDSLVEKLGNIKRSVGCVYIKKMDDIDIKVLKELIKKSMKASKNQA